jgi:hypothetical protein
MQLSKNRKTGSKFGVQGSRLIELGTWNFELSFGGGERVRTDDPLRARQVLSQLSYTPGKIGSRF